MGTSYSNAYTSTFDGVGHKISNLKIESSDNYAGFFGYVRSGGTVKDCDNSSTVSGSGSYIGAVAGYNNYGTIENCTWLSSTASTGIGSGSGDATSYN